MRTAHHRRMMSPRFPVCGPGTATQKKVLTPWC
ncbi:MAG: hypothetical protein BJ554DRAFT_8420 [Olpidium bornovanus]|uniref:Uncharacterized protein n=1 Tax=Olpidium bornovanus TaxID=278681 RepID=A0A8H7ZUY7_9FUNG|nr:MAG: hypothetical protein BJ554DRAFT_8420 [Olpidium bornovanus]